MHRGLVLVFVAACRFGFDLPATTDAGGATPDASLALACNTPVPVAPALATSSVRISASTTPSGVAIAWIEDDASIAMTSVVVAAGPTAIPTGRRRLAAAGPWVQLAIASDGGSVLLAAEATPSNGTSAWAFDTGMFGPLSGPANAPMSVLGPGGAFATPSGYLIAGESPSTTTTDVAVVKNGALQGGSTTVMNGFGQAVIFGLDARIGFAVGTVGAPGTCSIRSILANLTGLANLATWGGTTCDEPIAIHEPTQSQVLLVRHDKSDGDLNHVIATVDANGNFTIPVEGLLAKPGTSPRGTPAPDGYWVTYERMGQLEASHVTFTGTVDIVHTIGAMADPTAHDAFTIGSAPYAAWIDDGQVYLARICN